MNEIIVINETLNNVITVNNAVAAVTEKEMPLVITIGVPGPSGTSESTMVEYPSGEVISGHRAVIISPDDKVYYCSCSNISHVNKLAGISTGAAEINSPALIKTFGELEEPSWDWDTDKPLYAGINGMLTQNIPSSGFIQQVAWVITPRKIFINMQPPIIIN